MGGGSEARLGRRNGRRTLGPRRSMGSCSTRLGAGRLKVNALQPPAPCLQFRAIHPDTAGLFRGFPWALNSQQSAPLEVTPRERSHPLADPWAVWVPDHSQQEAPSDEWSVEQSVERSVGARRDVTGAVRDRAMTTSRGGTTPMALAQASFSSTVEQQHWRQHSSASTQPHGRSWQGNGVDDDLRCAGTGTPATERVKATITIQRSARRRVSWLRNTFPSRRRMDHACPDSPAPDQWVDSNRCDRIQ